MLGISAGVEADRIRAGSRTRIGACNQARPGASGPRHINRGDKTMRRNCSHSVQAGTAASGGAARTWRVLSGNIRGKPGFHGGCGRNGAARWGMVFQCREETCRVWISWLEHHARDSIAVPVGFHTPNAFSASAGSNPFQDGNLLSCAAVAVDRNRALGVVRQNPGHRVADQVHKGVPGGCIFRLRPRLRVRSVVPFPRMLWGRLFISCICRASSLFPRGNT